MKKNIIAFTLLFSTSSFAVDLDTCDNKTKESYNSVWKSIQDLENVYSDEVLGTLEHSLEKGVEEMPNCLYAKGQIEEMRIVVAELTEKAKH